MLIYVTRVCPRCGSKFAFRFSYSTIPPQFCDNCRRELMLKYCAKRNIEVDSDSSCELIEYINNNRKEENK